MSKRILTVDDSATMREMLSLTLRQAGFDVTQAIHGEAAIEQLQESPRFDLIITDLNMPGMDGFSLIEQVRKGKLAHRSVPILILTTEVDPVKKDRGRAVGATGWITKPFTPQKLVEIVGKVCA